MRDNLRLKKSQYPFVYLDPKLREAGKWWKDKLKNLINEFGDEIVARAVCNVVYFPYPSKKFDPKCPELLSQCFGFNLVRAAIDRRAIIVVMRKGKLDLWKHKVRELVGYEAVVVLRNPQNPTISPKNCYVGDYKKITSAIKSSRCDVGQASAVSLPQMLRPRPCPTTLAFFQFQNRDLFSEKRYLSHAAFVAVVVSDVKRFTGDTRSAASPGVPGHQPEKGDGANRPS
jgi:hypothetical protein